MTEKKKKILLIGGGALGLLLLVLGIQLAIDLATFHRIRFYFADIRYQNLVQETRKVHRGTLLSDNYTVRLAKEYFLGPLRYTLRLSFPEDVVIRRVFTLTNKGKEGLVIDFNSPFLKYAESDNEGCLWALEGLLKTLRVNTPVKRLYVMVEGRMPDIQVGNWSLSLPLQVEKGRTK